ncbi:hypothetical protein TYRP_003082 [Tyrophagus putrescentiae]|nr:hypothetical protein TYRP_003082 [Tyrophagus putrescentiae]
MEGQVPSSSSRSVEEGPIEHRFGGGGGNSPIEKHGRQASSASPSTYQSNFFYSISLFL